MSYLHDFPWTSEYDGDLSWLIREYKRLGLAVDDLSERVKTLEGLYSSIPDEIAKATAEMQAKVNAAIAQMQLTVNNQLAETNTYVREEIAGMNSRVDALEKEVRDQIATWTVEFNQMVAKLNELYTKLSTYVDNEVKLMKDWVKGYLMDWSRKWPMLIDPTDAKLEDIQTILYHMYNELSFGIVVSLFDGLEMSVQDFDDREIPVICFDKYGSFLFNDYRCCIMTSPFNGQRVPISEVVLQLTALHQNGVSVGEFDNANIEVQTFDDKEISAYDFDWSSVWFDELTGAAA